MCINRKIYMDALQAAYAHFNKALWNGDLPEVVITLQPKARSQGHFGNLRWHEGGKGFGEININPTLIAANGEREVLSTLVHEMAHTWQDAFGWPSRNGYHNKQWVEEMRRIGLNPVSLDSKNGTGQRVSHEIAAGGAFDQAYQKLVARKSWSPLTINRIDDSEIKGGGKSGGGKPKSGSRVKYNCGNCGASVWGKAGLIIACLNCETGNPVDRVMLPA